MCLQQDIHNGAEAGTDVSWTVIVLLDGGVSLKQVDIRHRKWGRRTRHQWGKAEWIGVQCYTDNGEFRSERDLRSREVT